MCKQTVYRITSYIIVKKTGVAEIQIIDGGDIFLKVREAEASHRDLSLRESPLLYRSTSLSSLFILVCCRWWGSLHHLMSSFLFFDSSAHVRSSKQRCHFQEQPQYRGVARRVLDESGEWS